MLPDYPTLKERLEKRLMQHLGQKSLDQTGIYSFVAKNTTVIQEGGDMIHHRPDGSEEPMGFQRASASIFLKADEITQSQASALFAQIDTASATLADQQARTMINVLDRVSEESDTVIKGTGPITPQSVLDHLRKYQMNFDKGEPEMPTFLGGIDALRELDAAMIAIEADPVLKRELDRIIETKRNEYRDREAYRQLVG